MIKMERSVDLSQLPTKKYGEKRNIDWDKCHEQGMMSMYIKIYEYKQKNPQSTNGELANKFHVNKETVSKVINEIKKYSIYHEQ